MTVAQLEVDLGKQVEPLDDLLGFPGEILFDLRAHESILERLRHPGLAPLERTADLAARCRRIDPHQRPATEPWFRKQAANAEVPVVIPRTGPDLSHGARHAPEFRGVGNRVHLDRIHDAQGQLERELSGHGIGGVRPVDEQGALTGARAVEAEPPAWVAHDPRQQRQGILKTIGRQLEDLQELRLELVLCERLPSAGAGFDGNHLGDRRHLQQKPDGKDLPIHHLDRPGEPRSVSRQFRRHDVAAGRQCGECESTVTVRHDGGEDGIGGDLRDRLSVGPGKVHPSQRHGHAGQHMIPGVGHHADNTGGLSLGRHRRRDRQTPRQTANTARAPGHARTIPSSPDHAPCWHRVGDPSSVRPASSPW